MPLLEEADGAPSPWFPIGQTHAGTLVGSTKLDRRAYHRRLVRYHQLDVDTGVLIVGLEPNSPAKQAGLEEGDLIVGFDGKPIFTIDDLQRLLTEERVGVTSSISIIRGTSLLRFEVTPTEAQ